MTKTYTCWVKMFHKVMLKSKLISYKINMTCLYSLLLHSWRGVVAQQHRNLNEEIWADILLEALATAFTASCLHSLICTSVFLLYTGTEVPQHTLKSLLFLNYFYNRLS